MKGLCRGVLSPETGFRRSEIYEARLGWIMLLAFALVVTGLAFRSRFYSNPEYNLLVLSEAQNRFGPEMRESNLETLILSPVVKALSITFQGLFSSTVTIALWLMSILLSQFLGGEEDEHRLGRHRRTFAVAAVSSLPRALGFFVVGAVQVFSKAEANALTTADYVAQTEVSLSLADFLGYPGIHPVLDFLAATLTNPFLLWSSAITFFGLKTVLRLGNSKAMIITIVAALAMGFEAAL